MTAKYNHKKIEKKWQTAWAKGKIYHASDRGKRHKKYVLIEFPYPSGEGLHMGHLRPYVAGDVYARFSRMQGHETMYPMGWDAFGLPAENYALKKGVHPSVSTAQNIKNAKRQVQSWGLSFDWSREVNTTDPNYYKWTQWIFLQLYKAGLAYEATGLINWCPRDKTGLANEEVIDGKCERCGAAVEKKELRQWYLRITAYAEKLLEGLKNLPQWPEQVKLQQENWIGKSEGAEFEFRIKSQESGIKKFVLLHGKGGGPEANFLPWLAQSLKKQRYEVQIPQLPGGDMPDDAEQMEYVKKHVQLDESTAVVGHSFGGIVLLRLLEQGIRVNKVVLVGTPYSGTFLDKKERPTVAVALKKGFDFEKIKSQAKNFVCLYDKHDYVVPVSDGKGFAEKLGALLVETISELPHFAAVEEPAVLAVLTPGIKIFTTRPDTIFGATYMVLAPEHPLVSNFQFSIFNFQEVKEYVERARNKTEIQRSAPDKEKTGVELKGIRAINPATGEEIPVWIADYVLMGYGTGAIMAVPAHDERDMEFAKKYRLKIRKVVNEHDELIDSGKFTGLGSLIAKKAITSEFGVPKVQYKLRDWVFSRQRYWGEPIPIVHCPSCGIVPVPDKDLPVKLPDVKKYEPTGTGESPLAGIDAWVNVKCPQCGTAAKRETNTMPQWAGSSWYFLRYADPKNKKALASGKLLGHWMPVDVYFGGMEHTTLHLLYSRFWNLFLFDRGIVPASEPYTRRVPHGIILGPDGEKMSKSRGNVVNPDEIVNQHGADVLRMYELFLGPHEATVAWDPKGIMGIRRFLERVWRLREDIVSTKGKSSALLHKTVKKVSEDIPAFKFNTAISAMMILMNDFENSVVSRDQYAAFLKLLAPFAPHLAEELWASLGHKKSIHHEHWPEYNEKLITEDLVQVAVQVNGKLRATVLMAISLSEGQAQSLAAADENVQKHLEGKKIRKVIYVPGKIINFVV